jgi:hypothetical protein
MARTTSADPGNLQRGAETRISRHTIRPLFLALGDHSTSPWQRFCFLLLLPFLFNYEFRYRLKSAGFGEFTGQILNFHDIAMIHSQWRPAMNFSVMTSRFSTERFATPELAVIDACRPFSHCLVFQPASGSTLRVRGSVSPSPCTFHESPHSIPM